MSKLLSPLPATQVSENTGPRLLRGIAEAVIDQSILPSVADLDSDAEEKRIKELTHGRT